MTPMMEYVLAPDGEIVKIVNGQYERTGMFMPK